MTLRARVEMDLLGGLLGPIEEAARCGFKSL
jgi:hypothetical protein